MTQGANGNYHGKYKLLNEFLLQSGEETLTMSFAEIETILGQALTPSAYKHSAWWSNSKSGHSYAQAWLCAGYKTSAVDMTGQSITFVKANTTCMYKTTAYPKPLKRKLPAAARNISLIKRDANTIEVCGYTFTYIQDLLPDCDSAGKVIVDEPQNRYDNKKGLPLLKYGSGTFCRFRIEAENRSGVYLWVCDNEIIYIGEAVSLRDRFNTGYGNISPRNCFIGGQSTNCKMNKVILEYFEQRKRISLYFYPTAEHKLVEKELLDQILTPYNVKDN